MNCFWPQAVLYEMNVRQLTPEGTLRAATSKLPFLKDLGVDAVWLMPVYPIGEAGRKGSLGSYYSIRDYCAVNPELGTMADFDAFVAEAHRLGMRVLLDWVANHTARDARWIAEKPASWYERDAAGRPAVPWDWSDTAKLNYADRDVWRAQADAMEFWVRRHAVDGFRCDMAMSLVKNDDRNHTATVRLWHEMREWIDARYPECILISEWSQPGEAIPAGFHVDLIIHNGAGYDMYSPLVCNTDDKNRPTVCYFDRAGEGQIRSFVDRYTKERHATREQGYLSMPTCSHDIWRLNRNQRNTPEELKVTMTFFLLMPWIPTVYYGEEIGMRNIEDAPIKEGSFARRNRSSCRTPMQWDTTPNAGFSTADATNIFLPVDPDPARPTVAAQTDDPHSLLSYTRGLLALRAATPALGTSGDWRYVSDPNHPYPMVYAREYAGEKYIVVLNPSAQRATAQFPEEGAVADIVYGSGVPARYTVRKDLASVKAEPVSATVLRMK